jgi:hypothetical protein
MQVTNPQQAISEVRHLRERAPAAYVTTEKESHGRATRRRTTQRSPNSRRATSGSELPQHT